MKTRLNRLCSLALTFVVAVCSLAAAPVSASAAVNIDAADSTIPAIGSTVYFGHYPQTKAGVVGQAPAPSGTQNVDFVISADSKNSNANTYYLIEPIAWRVLVNSNDELFLVTEKNIDRGIKYHESSTNITWENSELRAWLNGTSSPATYPTTSFIDTAFTTEEQGAIKTSTVVNSNNPTHDTSGGNDSSDKIFLLSIAETLNSGGLFLDDNSRKAVNTDYAASKSGIYGSGAADIWWLRSPGDSLNDAATVDEYGVVDVDGFFVNNATRALRPAIKLNLTSVLFTSDANGVNTKSDVTTGSILSSATAPTGENGHKLTITNSGFHSSFTASAASVSERTITLNFGNAASGVDKSVSAVIKDSTGAVTYYGQLDINPAGANGTTTVTIPDDFTATDALHIFCEQLNTGANADYTSSPVSVAVSQQVAPSNLTGVAPTTAANKNGKITGLNAGSRYEYKLTSAAGWTVADNGVTEISGLAPGTYQVRLRGKVDSGTAYLVSPAANITIENGVSPPTVGNITAPAAADVKGTLALTVPTVTWNGNTGTEGWQISANGTGGWKAFDPATAMTTAHNGRYLRYYATNSAGTGYSNTVQITLNTPPGPNSDPPKPVPPTNPNPPVPPTEPDNPTDTTLTPGDDSPINLWFALCLIAGIGIVGVMIWRRRMNAEA